MSYIYGAPSKARNANVVYIWTYVWQRSYGVRRYGSLTHSKTVCRSSAAVTNRPISIEFEVNT